MKKTAVILAAWMLILFVGVAQAGDDSHNPNSFPLDLTCVGIPEVIHITVPSLYSGGGQIEGGGVAIAFTHYIDFNNDGLFTSDEMIANILHGQGVQTTWCTWTWGNDPFTHGMDIKLVRP